MNGTSLKSRRMLRAAFIRLPGHLLELLLGGQTAVDVKHRHGNAALFLGDADYHGDVGETVVCLK